MRRPAGTYTAPGAASSNTRGAAAEAGEARLAGRDVGRAGQDDHAGLSAGRSCSAACRPAASLRTSKPTYFQPALAGVMSMHPAARVGRRRAHLQGLSIAPYSAALLRPTGRRSSRRTASQPEPAIDAWIGQLGVLLGLDHDPAVIADVGQRRASPREVEPAVAGRGEHAGQHAVQKAAALGSGSRRTPAGARPWCARGPCDPDGGGSARSASTPPSAAWPVSTTKPTSAGGCGDEGAPRRPRHSTTVPRWKW